MKFAGLEIHLLALSPRTVSGRLLGVSGNSGLLWFGFKGGLVFVHLDLETGSWTVVW